MDFKINDRVKMLLGQDDDAYPEYRGKVGTVIGYKDDLITVKFDNMDTRYAFPKRFELYKPEINYTDFILSGGNDVQDNTEG